jgi:hypothetical protein
MATGKKDGKFYLHRGNPGWVFCDWLSWRSPLDAKRDPKWRKIIGKSARRLIKKMTKQEIERELI